MKTVLVCLFFVLFGASLQAEMRYWRNVDGMRFEGEFSKELFDVYYFRTPGGKEIKIPADKLDPVDVDYLRITVPPRIEVVFLKSALFKKRSIVTSPDDVIEIITGKVTIKKISQLPYDGMMIAEVFLLGREVNREVNEKPVYRLLGKKTERFVFGDEKNPEHMFSLTSEVRKYVREDLPWGAEYFGHVVVVMDEKRNILWFESRLQDLKQENLADLRKIPVNSFLNGLGQRVPVPRPINRDDQSRWMALF